MMDEATKAAIFEARRRTRECDEVHQDNERLRSELAATKMLLLLQYTQAQIEDLQKKLARDCTNISCENGPAWLYPILDSRVSLSAKPSCEDGPAPIVPKVHTLNVRVWRDGSRLTSMNRRAAMRAFVTGIALPGYAAKSCFATDDRRTLAVEDIDWTGFGLQPIISVRRVIVLRNMGVLDESFERDAVLAEFQRTGMLPTGYQFPLKYWNLEPQDVNFAFGAKVGS